MDTNSKKSQLDPEIIRNLYWGQNKTILEAAKKFRISYWQLYNFMKEHNIQRRDRSESCLNFYRNKPQFKISASLSREEEKLKIASLMLYWAEGTLRGQTVDFVNSNPEMIKVFLRFLREICGVHEKRLRVYLYAYSYHKIERIKNYWSKITKISPTQFTKPYIRRGNPNVSARKLPYGLVHIRYNDIRLLKLICSWIEEYLFFDLKIGQVPKRPKGADCLKAASCRKARWKSG